MTLTWGLTAQLVVFATVISVVGYLYARHIAHAFDRQYGTKDKPPAE